MRLIGMTETDWRESPLPLYLRRRDKESALAVERRELRRAYAKRLANGALRLIAVLGIVGLLALLLASALWAQQQRTASWQYGALAGQKFAIDESAHPWGADGGDDNAPFTSPGTHSPEFSRRYAGGKESAGSQPIGHYGEDAVGIHALRNAYAGLCPGAINLRRTRSNAEEVWDLILTEPRWSQVYQQCYWQWVAGGTPERAIIVTAETWGEHAGRFTGFGGACSLGPLAVQELGPWKRHYDIRWLPGARPWCDWVKPAVGDRVEVQAFPNWLPGVVARVTDTQVNIRPEGGRGRDFDFADEGRLWRRLGAQPGPSSPTPTPTPQPTATPCPSCPPAKPVRVPAAVAAALEELATWGRGSRISVKRHRQLRDVSGWWGSVQACLAEDPRRSTGQRCYVLED